MLKIQLWLIRDWHHWSELRSVSSGWAHRSCGSGMYGIHIKLSVDKWHVWNFHIQKGIMGSIRLLTVWQSWWSHWLVHRDQLVKQGATSGAVETPECWICYDHGMSTKDSGKWSRAIQTFKTCYVCCGWKKTQWNELFKPLGAQNIRIES